jgi:hypothetical protein
LPNAIGVTAIAALNGPGAYSRQYRKARQILKNKKKTAARKPAAEHNTKKVAKKATKKVPKRKMVATDKRISVPNKGKRQVKRRTLTFEEWEQAMVKRNPKRRKKVAKKRRTRKVSALSAYMKKRKATAKKKSKVMAVKKRKAVKRNTAKRKVRKVAAKQKVRKVAAKRKVRKVAAKRKVRKVAAKRKVRKVAAKRKVRQNRAAKARRLTLAGTATKKRGQAKTYSVTGGMYLANKRKRRKSKKVTRKKSYLRNALMTGGFMKQLKSTLVVGGYATLGYVAHRAGTKLVKDLMFKDAEPESVGAKYGDLIASALVGLVGVPVAVKVAPADSKFVAAGMGVSFLQKAILYAAQKLDTTGKYAGYLQGLGEYYKVPAAGLGSYYKYPTAGLGSYYKYPTAGMGQIQQAAAGMGQIQQAAAGMGQLTQAAAGMGQIQQAAAGMGQLTQAAAGMGEYIAQGVQAIGEYEEVTPEYSRPMPVNEGIAPDLTSAERALSYAEAVSGVSGNPGVEPQPTVEPVDPALPITSPDEPAGSRLGTFGGANGVFGPFKYP